jgi:hypothetical protein
MLEDEGQQSDDRAGRRCIMRLSSAASARAVSHAMTTKNTTANTKNISIS